MSPALNTTNGASQTIPLVLSQPCRTCIKGRRLREQLRVVVDGLVTVRPMLVADIRHFLDMPDDAPTPAKRIGLQLSALVRAATARPTGRGATSAIGCTRRPGQRPCGGLVMVFRRTSGEIAWSCDVCGDEGAISGWEGSPADVSGLDDSYAEGDMVTLLIVRELFEGIQGVLLLDDACTAIEAALVGE